MVGGAVGYAAEGERRTIFQPPRAPSRLGGIMPMASPQDYAEYLQSALAALPPGCVPVRIEFLDGGSPDPVPGGLWRPGIVDLEIETFGPAPDGVFPTALSGLICRITWRAYRTNNGSVSVGAIGRSAP